MTESPPQIKQKTLINATLYTFLLVYLGFIAFESVQLGLVAIAILLASPFFVVRFPDELVRKPERQATLAEFGGSE